MKADQGSFLEQPHMRKFFGIVICVSNFIESVNSFESSAYKLSYVPSQEKIVFFLFLTVFCHAAEFSKVLEVPDHNPLMGIIGLQAGQLYTVVNSTPVGWERVPPGAQRLSSYHI